MESINLLKINLGHLEVLTFVATRFMFNLLATFIVVVLLYARNSRRKDYYFSYFAIGISIFLLCYLLENVKLELGVALGLFAFFGIIRYRTRPIPIKEMTYLFVIIALSVINALSRDQIGYTELTFVNVLLVGAVWALEKILNLRQEDSLDIIYENIQNVHRGRENELLADLEKRTGIKIKRYEVEKIDFLRDVAIIKIFFEVNGQNKSNLA